MFPPYAITERADRQRADALVMHCLPAHRGEEIESEVLDGPQSVVLDQAENRMWVQMAVLLRVIELEARPRTTSRSSSGSQSRPARGLVRARG